MPRFFAAAGGSIMHSHFAHLILRSGDILRLPISPFNILSTVSTAASYKLAILKIAPPPLGTCRL